MILHYQTTRLFRQHALAGTSGRAVEVEAEEVDTSRLALAVPLD
ncbi:hypothetical protein [Hymenobacter sp.]